LSVIHGVLLMLMLLLGLRWGATGVALAHVGTTVLFMYPKLYYSFLQTPVTMRGFFDAVTAPVVASTAMAAALVLSQRVVQIDSAAWELFFSACLAAPTYCAAMWAHARGRSEARALFADLQ